MSLHKPRVSSCAKPPNATRVCNGIATRRGRSEARSCPARLGVRLRTAAWPLHDSSEAEEAEERRRLGSLHPPLRRPLQGLQIPGICRLRAHLREGARLGKATPWMCGLNPEGVMAPQRRGLATRFQHLQKGIGSRPQIRRGGASPVHCQVRQGGVFHTLCNADVQFRVFLLPRLFNSTAVCATSAIT